jgi:serine/threonine protein kinase
MDKGDLKEFLKNFRSQNRELKQREEISVSRFYRIAAEIADGMLWLSEHKYIHRDLAARNCLLSKESDSNNIIVKLSDLGLARDVYYTSFYEMQHNRKLPFRWMAPESIFKHLFTTKSDVL